MIRVGVVDDQAMVRAGLTMILDAEDDIEVVGEAADGHEAITMVAQRTPDVVLMDVRMPGMDGLTATRELLKDDPPLRVIVLTTFDQDDYVYEALRAGASGFLLKSADGDSLVEAVRVVAAGEALLAPQVTRRVIEHFASGTLPAAPASAPHEGAASDPAGLEADLSERELEVLQLMARGLSNREIASQLFVSSTTVKTHVSHILSKLGVRDRVQAVVEAYESGLVTPGSADLSS